MRRVATFLATCLLAASLLAQEEETEPSAWYVGLSGALVLPQGGSRMNRAGGAELRAGRYFGDNLAAEGGAAWLEDRAGLTLQGLWHWQGCAFYDELFGYSRFDPFFTFGARGWLGRRDGQVGPKAGLGACYHLTDAWALRTDADVTLGLDSRVEAVYSVLVGVRYSF